MGGHHSKQTYANSTNALASAVQKTTMNSINYVQGNNVINLSGSGNVVSDVTQKMSISVSAPALSKIVQAADFSTTLASNVTQHISNHQLAFTQWLDNSSSDAKTEINDNVQTNVSASTVQNCVTNLNSSNIFNVSGSQNAITDILQTSTVNMVAKCLMNQAQSAKAAVHITNCINQHSKDVGTNPFSFITDAVQGVADDVVKIAAIIFVVIVCFIFLVMLLRRGKKDRASAAAAAVAAPSRAPAAPTAV
jgi:hypothetical protein